MTQFIYTLLDQNGQPFYVGKTKNPKQRKSRHLSRCKAGDITYVYNKIRKLLASGFELNIKVLEVTTDEQVDERERFHIADLRAKGVKLCNLTDGGEGGIACDPETLRRIHLGRKRSEETRKRMSEARKGIKFTKAHKLALRKAWKRTPEQLKQQAERSSKTSKGRINIKKYICISPTGEEFVTEHGLTMFCEEHGLTASNMLKVLHNERPNHKGWKIRSWNQSLKAS